MTHKHEQVITRWVDHDDDSFLAAQCPYCGAEVRITTVEGWQVVDPYTQCTHANMAVDSGTAFPAIHFEKNRG